MLVEASSEGVPYAFRRFVDEASGLLNEFEGLVGMPVLPIIMSPYRFIDHGVVDAVYSAIRGLSFRDLAIILNSAGGDIDEAYLLARYLQGIVSGRLVVYVLRLAKSAASLIALSGDELVMTPVAELGPVDPVTYYARARRFVPIQSIIESFNRVLETLRRGELPDKVVSELLDRLPIVEIGDYARALEHNIDLLVRVLTARMLRNDADKAREVARRLTGYKQHSAAITINDLIEVGLKARVANSREEELLWRLYESFIVNVIEAEELLPPDVGQEMNIRLGKGVLIAKAPIPKEAEENE